MPRARQASQATNLLFICSDQHSRHILGAYGNPIVCTPNLDALAARGTLFRNAYTNTPICVPARACLATGRYAHTIDSWDNGTPYVGTEAPSWGHRLLEQGHRVTTIGKLHYRKPEDPTGFPDQRLPMHVLHGIGDPYGILRDRMPVLSQSRLTVLQAGPGESEYTRYDRAVCAESVKWLQTEAKIHASRAEHGRNEEPWALFVSFVHPHFPLTVPQEYLDLYPPESIPMPVCWRPEEWATHPALTWKRNIQALDEPLDEPAIRRALAVYYGMVTFLDEQIGKVLNALRESGLEERTRVIYTSDHGDMMGEHGLWFKSVMYDGAAGIPMIVAGPDVPAGKVSHTNVSLVDCFPSIVEAVGAQLAEEDASLPGRSLFALAREGSVERTVFSEYHAIYASCGIFMVRHGHHKLVHYADTTRQHHYLPQLFDLKADPDERRDLAANPALAAIRTECERVLHTVCIPEEVDHRARTHQAARIKTAGGAAALIAAGPKFAYTPPPSA